MPFAPRLRSTHGTVRRLCLDLAGRSRPGAVHYVVQPAALKTRRKTTPNAKEKIPTVRTGPNGVFLHSFLANSVLPGCYRKRSNGTMKATRILASLVLATTLVQRTLPACQMVVLSSGGGEPIEYGVVHADAIQLSFPAGGQPAGRCTTPRGYWNGPIGRAPGALPF
jgi:hypothetical protein